MNKLSVKQNIIILLVLVMLFSFAGCGNDEQNKDEVQNNQIQSENTDVKTKDASIENLKYQIPKMWKKTSKDDISVIGDVTAYDTKNDCIVSIQTATWDQIQESAFGEFYSTVGEFMNGEISSIKYSESVSDVTESDISVAGTEGTVLEYSYNAEDGSSVIQRDVIFSADNVFYRINASNLAGDNESLFDMMIESMILD